MPRYREQVSNFSAGELSPSAQDAVTKEVWRAGAERLENLLVRREGGVQTRPGLRPIATSVAFEDEFGPPRTFSALNGLNIQLYEDSGKGQRTQRGVERTGQPRAGLTTVRMEAGPNGVVPLAYTTSNGRPERFPRWGRRIDFEPGVFVVERLDGDILSAHLAVNAIWTIQCDLLIPLHSLEITAQGLDTNLGRVDGSSFRAAFTLWGDIAGLGWFRLTPFLRGGTFLGVDMVRFTETGETRIYSLAPSLHAHHQPEVYVGNPDNVHGGRWQPEAVAYRQIALIAEECDRPDMGAQGRINFRSLRANVSKSRATQVRGERNTAARDAINALSANPVEQGELRYETWPQPAGDDLLMVLHEQGVLALAVPRGTGPLQKVGSVDVVFGEAVHELSVAHDGTRFYIAHPWLRQPLRIQRSSNLRSLEISPVLLADSAIPRDAAGAMLWGNDDDDGPVGVAVIQSRLCFVGSKSHPGMMAFSKVGNHDDFTTMGTAASEEDPYTVEGVTGAGALHALVEQKRIMAFGTAGEVFRPDARLTGATLGWEPNSRHGSRKGMAPIATSDLILMVQGDGTDIRALVYSDEENGFRTPSMAQHAPHLVSGTKAVAWSPGQGRDPTQRLWAVREEGLSSFSFDRDAQTAAWTRHTIAVGGRVDAIAVASGRLFAGAHVQGSPAWLCELARDDDTGCITDFARVWEHFDPRTDTLEAHDALSDVHPDTRVQLIYTDLGTPHLPRGHANYRLPGTRCTGIAISGLSEFNLEDILPGSRVEVGLPIQWVLRTLPVLVTTRSGTAVAVQKTRIVRLAVDFEHDYEGVRTGQLVDLTLNTCRPSGKDVPQSLNVNGRPVHMRCVADTPEIARARMGPRRGWKRRQAIEIDSQEPATIIGMSYLVAGGS